MGDLVTFAPNTGVNPTFAGRGSKIEHPDLFPIFWGSYWPGNGELTVSKIMDALNSIVSGPYLQGLRQYGFVGPAQVRPPRVDSSPCNIPLPAAAPNVDQANAIANAVHAYIENLLDDDDIDNVDDNHDLIVLVFLDPNIPTPSVTDAFGNVISVRGANSSVDDFEFLDDNTRFEWAWIGSADRKLATVTRFLAHELVESITVGTKARPLPAQTVDRSAMSAIRLGSSMGSLLLPTGPQQMEPASSRRPQRAGSVSCRQ